MAHCIRSVQELVSLDVRFLSASEGIDTGVDNPMSRFLLHLFAAFAEMEREIIRERVRADQRGQSPRKAPRVPQRVFRPRRSHQAAGRGPTAQTLGIPMSTVIATCRSESPTLG